MSFESQDSGEVFDGGAPSPEQSAPVAAPEGTQSQDASAGGQEKSPPFHEHPRFREVIEQNRAYKEQMAQLQSQVQEMQNRWAQQSKPAPAQTQTQRANYEQYLQKLAERGVDPEFIEAQKELYQMRQEAQSWKQQLDELRSFQAETITEKAQSKLDGLLESSKVPQELRREYQSLIENKLYRMKESGGKRLTLNDIDQAFKEVHEDRNKFYEDFKRAERAKYLSEKKADAAPASQTGGAPAGQPKPQMDREQAKAAILKELRGNKAPI